MVSFENFLQITYFLCKKKILCVYSCIMNASQEPYVDHPYSCDSDLAQYVTKSKPTMIKCYIIFSTETKTNDTSVADEASVFEGEGRQCVILYTNIFIG